MDKSYWYRYYFPLWWTFSTRYRNVINVISFFIIDALPSFYIVAMYSEKNFDNLLWWPLAFVTMFCFYECGYIFNEIICVRFEKDPTIRIPEPFFSNILRHIENLITIRLVLGTIASWVLVSKYPQNFNIYLFLVLSLLIVYSIHNFYRGKVNIITMSIEVFLKYMIPVSIFIKEEFVQAGVLIFLIIVLVRMLEYISKKRFIFAIRVTANVDSFRIRYYVVINIFVGMLIYFHQLPLSAVGLSLFFLIYRVASYIAMKHVRMVSSVVNDGRKMHGTDK